MTDLAVAVSIDEEPCVAEARRAAQRRRAIQALQAEIARLEAKRAAIRNPYDRWSPNDDPEVRAAADRFNEALRRLEEHGYRYLCRKPDSWREPPDRQPPKTRAERIRENEELAEEMRQRAREYGALCRPALERMWAEYKAQLAAAEKARSEIDAQLDQLRQQLEGLQTEG